MNKLEHQLRVRLLALQRRLLDRTTPGESGGKTGTASANGGSITATIENQIRTERGRSSSLLTSQEFGKVPAGGGGSLAGADVSEDVGVFVLGMHRSGTSAANRVINLLGVPVNSPTDWLAPTVRNPKGYWESASLASANDQLFTLLGCDCWCPPDLHPGWEREPHLDSFREQANSSFNAVFRTRQWAWKDPRNCITFPFWVYALEVRPVVVLIYRNPLEVAHSLGVAMEATTPLSRAHRLALWERYVRQTLANVVGLPVLVTHYEDLLEDIPAWCDQTRSFLTSYGVSLNDDYSLSEITAFLEKKLRHTRFTLSDVYNDPDASEEQAQLFERLGTWRGIYPSFELPELPLETAWTETLLAERRRALSTEAPVLVGV